jgi:uncharacterized membrane protein
MKSDPMPRHNSQFRFLKFILVLMAIASASVSQAKPEFLRVFNTVYNPSPSSALGMAKCGICHVSSGPPMRNPYGKDLKSALNNSKDGQFTAEILQQVEKLDSDGDGYTNIEEISQGFLPGDPASHPSAHGVKPMAKPATSIWSLIPSHGFHPVFIHFPIALFIFAVFLEFMGLRQKNKALGVAAQWNLHGALASLLLVIPTGVAAWLIGGHKLEGTMLYHLCLAIASVILMIATIITRKRLGPESRIYWAILLLGAAIIGLTGHFGGTLVYG